ncbi:MAG: ribonuclease HII [Gammaproteobacteria bacterium]
MMSDLQFDLTLVAPGILPPAAVVRPCTSETTGSLIAGVDEAGRGPLAGPVIAAAVILDPHCRIKGLADSKTLTAMRREQLDSLIRERALCWSLGLATVDEIDGLNILQASLLAMQRAVAGLNPSPQCVLVDGDQCPRLDCTTVAVIGGDSKIAAISAASIIAKVARDRHMQDMDAVYPGYGFARHKGYGTEEHLAALQSLGVTPIHRRSFSPVRARLASSNCSRFEVK